VRICIASDHGGYDLKQHIISHLQNTKHVIENLGCHNKDSVDYPYFGHQVGMQITQGLADTGIVICGTGIGISIAANRFLSVRAALCYDTTTARLSREHNDANVLALGARQTAPQLACEIVDVFLSTQFEGGRHQRRIDQLS